MYEAAKRADAAVVRTQSLQAEVGRLKTRLYALLQSVSAAASAPPSREASQQLVAAPSAGRTGAAPGSPKRASSLTLRSAFAAAQSPKGAAAGRSEGIGSMASGAAGAGAAAAAAGAAGASGRSSAHDSGFVAMDLLSLSHSSGSGEQTPGRAPLPDAPGAAAFPAAASHPTALPISPQAFPIALTPSTVAATPFARLPSGMAGLSADGAGNDDDAESDSSLALSPTDSLLALSAVPPSVAVRGRLKSAAKEAEVEAAAVQVCPC